jgi:excisionase family DNA binding protein
MQGTKSDGAADTGQLALELDRDADRLLIADHHAGLPGDGRRPRRPREEDRVGEGKLPRLLTTKEVAAYLKVPVATLHAWRYRGVGPRAFPMGRGLRYPEDDLLRWVASHTGSAS